uniref:CBS domain-containing protein n=1 Tax=Erythrolobus australicus TaxID=1077150 RepID=A0A7S1TQ30_9RHOD|mmetsp:Transcript_785/g.2130  ORF Transcript_785/g.2130 Transcript_785/m.2130 type:complete len:813 (+) Transcript_785:44-2482(+)
MEGAPKQEIHRLTTSDVIFIDMLGGEHGAASQSGSTAASLSNAARNVAASVRRTADSHAATWIEQAKAESGSTSSGSTKASTRGHSRSASADDARQQTHRTSLQASSRSPTFFLPPGATAATSSAQGSQQRSPEDDDMMEASAWIYLALISSLSFGICIAVTWLATRLNDLVLWAASTASASNSNLELVFLIVLRAVLAATAFYSTRILGDGFSTGSGLPEVKCVLGGAYQHRVLSVRTLLSKMLGLSLALASRLSVGRLGPFIHFSVIVAAQVSQLRALFPRLAGSPKLQMQAFSAAAAAGVSATTGSPLGGALLSMELTGLYFFVHWLPVALYSAIAGYLLGARFLRLDQLAYFHTEARLGLRSNEVGTVFLVVALGAICGVAGACGVKLALLASRKVRFLTARWHLKPIRIAALVVSVCVAHSVISAGLGELFEISQRSAVIMLFEAKSLPLPRFCSSAAHSASVVGLVGCLVGMTSIKVVLTVASVVLPLPAGVFMPVFFTGALLGRAYGELACHLVGPRSWLDPRAFAVIGSAALTAGVLHTVSIAVVILELIGSTSHGLGPWLVLSCVVSYFVSKNLSADLFSELIKSRDLPLALSIRELSMPELRAPWRSRLAIVPVNEFMQTQFPSVYPDTTAAELARLLRSHWTVCAVLSDRESCFILGTMRRTTLLRELTAEESRALAMCAIELGDTRVEPVVAYGATVRSDQREQDDRASTYGGLRIEALMQFDPNVNGNVAATSALINAAPFGIHPMTPYWKVSRYFQMLGLPRIYIVARGRCMGLVTKQQFLKFSSDARKRYISEGTAQ